MSTFGISSLFLLLVLSPASWLWGADAPHRPKITGVAHMALYVQDIDKARIFYKNLLGYDEPFSLNKPSGPLDLTFIKVNDRQYIELFPEREAKTDRLNHISIETDDAEAMRRYLASKGVKVPEKSTRYASATLPST